MHAAHPLGRAGPSSQFIARRSNKAFVTADSPAEPTLRPETETSASTVAEWLTTFFPRRGSLNGHLQTIVDQICPAALLLFRSKPTLSKWTRRMGAGCCATHTGIAGRTCIVA